MLTPGFRVPVAAVCALRWVVEKDPEVLGHRALALEGLGLGHGVRGGRFLVEIKSHSIILFIL